jgi:hypothetical protein
LDLVLAALLPDIYKKLLDDFLRREPVVDLRVSVVEQDFEIAVI